ncbi:MULTISPECIES: hypothetical protein [unclassified Micromonospora]
MVIDSDQPDLTRRIVHARADTIPHPRIARAYPLAEVQHPT